jgi:hypothetical protein
MAKTLQVRSAPRKSAPVTTDLDRVLAAFHAQPQQTISAMDQMVRDVAAREGVDLASLTPGRKAVFTKRVKLAMKSAGITI